nr:MAG TPA: hypothetical protein [Caudoviricetes sp.]
MDFHTHSSVPYRLLSYLSFLTLLFLQMRS